MMAHAYKPIFLGRRDSRIVIGGQPGEKISKTLSQKADTVMYLCTSSYAERHLGVRHSQTKLKTLCEK
jgi:hypothetical protein